METAIIAHTNGDIEKETGLSGRKIIVTRSISKLFQININVLYEHLLGFPGWRKNLPKRERVKKKYLKTLRILWKEIIIIKK